ncbi:MAG: hypothetical protein JNK02_08140 [Planctomycetes bacterium]|nr:hypothetical protein [Planctomycetota bacterium]
MSGDAHKAPGSDDLFDLPEKTPVPQAPEARVAADGLPPALPQRAPRPASAGPLLTSVDSAAAAVLDSVRQRAPKPVEAAPVPDTEPALPSPARPRALWIGLGVLAFLNAVTLAVLSASHAGRDVDERAAPVRLAPAESARAEADRPDAAQAASAARTTREADAQRAQQPTPRVGALASGSVLPELSALEAARNVLGEARADLASGRRSAARARLGRLALSIDAVESTRREEIRAEIALLVAHSLQQDAEEARRWQQ